jgi:hypothetical protein
MRVAVLSALAAWAASAETMPSAVGDHLPPVGLLPAGNLGATYTNMTVPGSASGTLNTYPGTAWYSVYNYYAITYPPNQYNQGFNVGLAFRLLATGCVSIS